MLERCETCKWWVEYDGHPDDLPPGWRICRRMACAEGDPEDTGTLAQAMNYWESESSQVTTAPDFGCVMHTPNEE